MKEKTMMILADTIQGEINRMCVTRELSEFDTMYLHACKIIFEASPYFENIYFTMYLDKSELDQINEFLEVL